MFYKRIYWKDRIVVLNDDGTINKVIQEGTPLSSFNLNLMDDAILKIDYDTDLIKKNQLELLISRDLENQRVSMDEGYWFDSLKDENKINIKNGISILNNKATINGTSSTGEIEFNTHDIEFKTNKTTYFHKRKLNYMETYSATNRTTDENKVDVIAELITIKY
jgi:hypothetical protein